MVVVTLAAKFKIIVSFNIVPMILTLRPSKHCFRGCLLCGLVRVCSRHYQCAALRRYNFLLSIRLRPGILCFPYDDGCRLR
jgi:hypothetical protein